MAAGLNGCADQVWVFFMYASFYAARLLYVSLARMGMRIGLKQTVRGENPAFIGRSGLRRGAGLFLF